MEQSSLCVLSKICGGIGAIRMKTVRLKGDSKFGKEVLL